MTPMRDVTASEALERLLSDDAHTITTDEERPGSIFHYHLPEGEEIVVYPLLFGQARLCNGRIDRDHWWRGFTYNSHEEAIEAAIGWTNLEHDPPGNWIRKQIRGVE